MLPGFYEMLLIGCMMHDVGDIHQFASINEGKNGSGVLYLDGIKVMFTKKRCKPIWVLDATEYLHPDNLEEEQDEQQEGH